MPAQFLVPEFLAYDCPWFGNTTNVRLSIYRGGKLAAFEIFNSRLSLQTGGITMEQMGRENSSERKRARCADLAMQT